MIKNMTIEEIKAEYYKLLPIKTMIGERSWVNRLETWKLFLNMGRIVADHLRQIHAYYLMDYDEDVYKKEMRHLNPGLHDLVLKVFPEQKDKIY